MTRLASSGDLIADRRLAYAQAALDDGDASAACDLAEQALERAPRWSEGWMLLGRARAAAGLAVEAAAAFDQVLMLDPSDRLGAAVERALLPGHRLAPADQPMSAAYVRTLFDAYAGRFDDHLAGLGYRAPALIDEALRAHKPFRRAVDLGCGTGLMGSALRADVGWLAGCDLSPAMLAKAGQRGIYDVLSEDDGAAFLGGLQPASLDLVVAADVFVYVGDLAPTVAAAAHALRRGGLFAFTVQSTDLSGFVLGEDRRFHHSDRYLREVSRDTFDVVSLQHAALRMDRGEPVAGAVVLMIRR